MSVFFTVKTVGRLMENESTILVPDERYGAPEVICDEVLSPKKSSSKSRVVSVDLWACSARCVLEFGT